MPKDLRKAIDEANKPKHGEKPKSKAGPSEPVITSKKKVKKPVRKPRSPTPNVQDDSDSQTNSDFRRDDTIQHETDDTSTTSEPQTSTPILKVSTPPSSSMPFSDSFWMHTPPPSPKYFISNHYFCPDNHCTTTKYICGCFSSSDLYFSIYSTLY